MGKKIELKPWQKALMDDKSPKIIAAWGRRTGKTTFNLERIRKGKGEFLIVVNTDSQKELYLRSVPKATLVKSSVIGNEYEIYGKRVTFTTYGRLFSTVTGKKKYEAIILDEPSWADQSTVELAKTKLDKYTEQLYFIGTPKQVISEDNLLGQDVFNRTFINAAAEGFSRHVVRTTEVMGTEEAAELYREMSKDRFAAEVLVAVL